jgi:hypothetical protein
MFGGMRLGLMGTPMDSIYGHSNGGVEMSGNGMSNMDVLNGLTGRTGNPMAPVGGGGVTGGKVDLFHGGFGGFGGGGFSYGD